MTSKPSKRSETPTERSRSVSRALRLLHEVSTHESGLTLSEASRSVELAVSTVARLLKTLEQSGYVVRSPAGRYSAGAKILQIGAVALGDHSLYQLAGTHLLDISEFTAETAYLAVPDGVDRAVYLRQVESPRAIRHAMWTGRAISTEGTALGTILFGEADERGFATSRGTSVEPDAAAAAAPLTTAEGAVVGALSMIGPSFRITDESLLQYGEFIRSHADQLSQKLRLRILEE